ncbi:DMT family transporter [uncultured Cocleimonas sp.]|uniref:DMT family transporter n=1 Tax=uncultured Cocleimonas sp. TaxID=1051587 RepID=UPI00263218A7|nr:DMT family transporter [uncultured Cocleimonas sp.]
MKFLPASMQKYLPYLTFLLLALAWGCTFVFIKIANEFISAEQIAFYRVFLGFLLVAVYGIISKSFDREHLKHWKHLIAIAVLASLMHFLFFAKGTVLLNSGIAGALSGSIPLFAFVLSIAFIKEEHATWVKLCGILLGFLGVVLIANPFNAGADSANLYGVMYLLLGSAAVGASFVYAKKYIAPLGISVIALTAYQLGLGLLMMIPFIDFTGILNVWSTPKAIASTIIGLGLINTAIASIAYYYVVDKLGAVRASSVTYLPPVIAMIIAVFLLGEKIQTLDYLALALIFAGMLLLREKTASEPL